MQTCEVSGQELLTEDKVTVRANVVCNYRITDAPKWFAQHQSPEEYLYRASAMSCMSAYSMPL